MKSVPRVPQAVLGVVLIGLLLTAVAAAWQVQRNQRTIDEAFARLTEQVSGGVSNAMTRCAFGLRGARGAVISAGPDQISRAGFLRYAKSRKIDEEFPGARSFGYIRRVAPADEASFLAAARRDGKPDFSIRQFEAHSGDRFIIQYIEPAERNAAAIGLDIASEANRREAALRAIREDGPILTGPITLVQAQGKPKQSFLLLLPVYQNDADLGSPAAREAATKGWAYAPLSIEDVLLTLDAPNGDYTLTLRDRTGASADQEVPPFYSTQPDGEARPAVAVAHRPIQIYGREWIAEIRATPDFVASLRLLSPGLPAAGGVGLTLLLAAVAWLLSQAARRDAELLAEQAHRAALVESSSDAIIGANLDGKITSWNPAAQAIFGFAAEDVLGQPMDILLPASDGTLGQGEALERIARNEVVAAYDTVRRTRDGRELDVTVSVVPVRDLGGRVIGLAKTIRDNSERKAAERGLQTLAQHLEATVAERTAGLEAAKRDLRTILDALPSMVGYWDAGLHNRFANKAYQDWFGVSPEALTGKTLQELLGSELFERNRPFVEAALSGEAQTFERDLPRPGGPGSRHSLAHYLPDLVDGEVRGFYVLVHDVTELTETRRQAAAAQRDNEFLLQTIHQHAIVSVTDARGIITDANEAFCKISGYALDELLGQTHRIVNSRAHSEGFWVEVWRTIANGRAWRGEVCNRAKDGSLYWVDSIIAPFADDQGRVQRYISIRFDFTERKRSRAQLDATHERLALAADAAGIGCWEYELQSQVLHWDDQMYRLYGRTRAGDAEPYAVWSQNVHPDDVAASEQALRDCIAGLRDFNVEFRVVYPDGRIRHICAAAKTYRDEFGTAVRMVGVNWDITERKQSEVELASATSLLRTVLASATDVSIIATDADLVLRVFNRGAERLLGYTSQEVVGIETPGLIHDPLEVRQRAQELSASAGRLIAAGDYFKDPLAHGSAREWRYTRKDGTTVLVSLIVTAMLDQAGTPLGYLGIAYDVTAQKEQEQALLRAKQAAEKASLAKSQFLANMSHEIRTPMNAIIGLGYLLEQTHLDGQQADFLQKMTRASKGLLGVINDVLDLSKIEAGELSISMDVFEPAALLDYLCDVLQAQATLKKISLSLEMPADLPAYVKGDALRLNQILTNLLGNAIKFTEQGGVRLLVQVVDADADRVQLRFEVHDSGIGISPDSAKLLFQPFAQADNSITRRFGGTGLGLSIVKQLAEMMGGRVGVDSAVGTGSCFWVELPFAIASAPQDRPQQPDRDFSAGSALAGIRILVADDSQINLEVAKRILEGEGAEVAMAVNGQVAVAYLQAQPDGCDIVLMDVHMPVMDGLTATQTIRNQLGLTLPIVALTAGALASQRQEAEHVGMSDFVVKPFSPHELVACIRKYVHVGVQARHPSPGEAASSLARPAAEDWGHWPELPGIAGAEVAMRLGGDQALFATLLKYLVSEFPEFPLLTADEDLHGLAARVHKLRGGAGNVGAVGVHRVATDIEAACRAGDHEQVAALLPVLNAALKELATGVEAWRAEQAKRPSATPSGPAARVLSRKDMESLLELLKQQHISALDLFEELAPGLEASLGTAAFERLRSHIEQLQFADAAMELDTAITDLPAS